MEPTLEQKESSKKAQEEITAILAKYNCTFDVQMLPQITILPKQINEDQTVK